MTPLQIYCAVGHALTYGVDLNKLNNLLDMKEQPLEPREPREKPERDEMEESKKHELMKEEYNAFDKVGSEEDPSEESVDQLLDRIYTSDFERGFKHIQAEVYKSAVEKGWWDDYNNTIKLLRQAYAPEECVMAYQKAMQLSKLMLLVSELGEMTESLRKPGKPDEHCPKFTNTTIEAADAVIRLMDFCENFSIPLAEAIIAKMRYNATRPYKHGKLV